MKILADEDVEFPIIRRLRRDGHDMEAMDQFDARMQRALDELLGMIVQRFPTATFSIARGEDEPDNVHLTAVVHVEEADEVLDLVIDRVVELQVEERIPIHVIPVRTPDRVLAALQARTNEDKQPFRDLVALLAATSS